MAPHGEERLFIGEIFGTILRERRGESGFGYDPVFLPLGKERTTAEMTSEEKAAISHRGNAMRQFLEWMRDTKIQGGA